MSDLRRWQRLAIDRAVVAEMAKIEVEQARDRGDPESLAIADRYHDQATRMLNTALRKMDELERIAA
jgi:hypothetical protein